MSFQLFQGVDKNKVFLVRLSKLKKRLDPTFYKLKFFDFLSTTSFRIEKIGNCIISANSGFGVGRGKQVEADTGVLQIRPTNLGDYGILKFDKNVFVPSNAIPSKRHFLENGDILFNNTNSQELVGKTAIYFSIDNNPVTYSNHITVLKVDTRIINPKYLWLLLNTYQRNKVFYSICTNWNNQSGVGVDLLKSLKIPVPNMDIQNGIAGKFDAAYTAKKQKEVDAQQLLEGIDDYLLGELGIERTVQEENTIDNRIFYRKIAKVSGGRFDAPVHHRDYSLSTKSYPMERLKDCVFINPLTSFFKFKSDKIATFIPMESVSDEYGEADLSQCRTVAESGGYTKFLENDLIWAKITPCMQNGKSAVVSQLENGIGFGSTEFHVFRAHEGIDIRYIHALLRLKSLRDSAMLYFSGSAGHQRVSDDFFKRLIIPKPPFEKQIQIAEHISTIRNRAKQLKQEAKAELEHAKKEVEGMILGDKP